MNESTPHHPQTVDPASSAPQSALDSDAKNLPQIGTVAFTDDSAGSEAPIPATPAIPGYEILGVLGRGGMGVVYKAREIALERLVALKVVTAGAHAGTEQLIRFRAEARAEARLQHPHIVQVHTVGEHEGFPYLSLEYMDGGNLAQKIARQPQPPREAAQLVYLLARAMAFAHQRGIIHRDLKPANILRQKRDAARARTPAPPRSAGNIKTIAIAPSKRCAKRRKTAITT